MKLHADIENMEDNISKLKELINDKNEYNIFRSIEKIKKQLDYLNTSGWKGNDSNTFCSNYLAYLEYVNKVFLSYRKLILMSDDLNNHYREIDDLKNYFNSDNGTFIMTEEKAKEEKEEISEEEISTEVGD